MLLLAAGGNLLQTNWSPYCRKKLVLPHKAREWADNVRSQKKTVTTLNGSFDLLHAGHLHILYEASLQGDLLIVALNSDKSIQHYKGKQRPIIPLKYRLQMMAAIHFVDFVTWFDEDTPCELLKEIRPHTHVNGADYGLECIERAIVEEGGGKIHIVSFVDGLSTSNIMNKISQICV